MKCSTQCNSVCMCIYWQAILAGRFTDIGGVGGIVNGNTSKTLVRVRTARADQDAWENG